MSAKQKTAIVTQIMRLARDLDPLTRDQLAKQIQRRTPKELSALRRRCINVRWNKKLAYPNAKDRTEGKAA